MNKSDKIARFIDRKILPSGIIPSILIFAAGAVIFYGFLNDKSINGLPILLLAVISYILLGVGIYGIFSWVGKMVLKLLAFILKLIFKGQLQITIDEKGLSSKLHYK